MKRRNNGLLIGTILIVLVGALIFMQARNQEPADEDAGPAMPGATTPAPGGVPAGPRVDEHLDSQGSGRGPSPAPGMPPQ
jgi:hypothetical protein